MVHGKYHVPERFRLWVIKYLGKVSLPMLKSDEGDIVEDFLKNMRRKSVHQVSLKTSRFSGKTGLVANEDIEENVAEIAKLSRLGSPEYLNLRERNTSCCSDTPQMGQEFPATLKRLSNVMDELKGMIQSEIKVMKCVQSDIHYMTLEKIRNRFSPEEIAKAQMKELAVILNRLTGIILTIFNVALIIYAGLVMLTPWNGFELF